MPRGRPCRNQAGHDQRIRDDLRYSKTRLLRDGASIAATITVDAYEPMAEKDQPVWPSDKDPKPAVYIRRIVVSRPQISGSR